jgi:hypothetical protein
MEKINPLNVAKLLFEEISSKYSKSSSINEREIELKDNLLTLLKAPNIYVRASTSGKLTKEELKVWFKDVFFPAIGERSVLLVDSWTTYKDRVMIQSVTPEDKEIEIVTIPPNTTSLVQPLDKYGFRLWKYLYVNFPIA